jgi:hypothetical protein
MFVSKCVDSSVGTGASSFQLFLLIQSRDSRSKIWQWGYRSRGNRCETSAGRASPPNQAAPTHKTRCKKRAVPASAEYTFMTPDIGNTSIAKSSETVPAQPVDATPYDLSLMDPFEFVASKSLESHFGRARFTRSSLAAALILDTCTIPTKPPGKVRQSLPGLA